MILERMVNYTQNPGEEGKHTWFLGRTLKLPIVLRRMENIPMSGGTVKTARSGGTVKIARSWE